MTQQQIEAQFPVGSKVVLSERAAQWYLENSYDNYVICGTDRMTDKARQEHEEEVQMMMCHLMGETVEGTVLNYGTYDNGDQSLAMRVQFRLGDWMTETYYESLDLTLLDSQPILEKVAVRNPMDEQMIEALIARVAVLESKNEELQASLDIETSESDKYFLKYMTARKEARDLDRQAKILGTELNESLSQLESLINENKKPFLVWPWSAK